MIVIVDYGLGNLGSIKNMLKKIGVEAIVTRNEETLLSAKKLILPGVGAFDNGMGNLMELGLSNILNKKVLEEKTPILGICLGMQLFTKNSEEGSLPGLGWIDAKTLKFKFTDDQKAVKIPHMSWNDVKIAKASNLVKDMENESRFYFVHSYYVSCNQPSDVLTTTTHGNIEYVSSFEKDNILGVQFHPEKSHKYGMKLLKNFADNY